MGSKSQCPPYFKVFVSKNKSEHFKAFRTNRDTSLSGWRTLQFLSTLYGLSLGATVAVKVLNAIEGEPVDDFGVPVWILFCFVLFEQGMEVLSLRGIQGGALPFCSSPQKLVSHIFLLFKEGKLHGSNLKGF